MPPRSCERAVRGFTMRPAANTPSSRGTRTSPVSTSTRDLGELRAEGVPGERRVGLDVVAGVGRRPRARRRASPLSAIRSRSARHAFDAPPSPRTRCPSSRRRRRRGGSSLSPSSIATSAGGTPSASAAIWVERGARAGADVGRVDPDHEAAVRGRARAAPRPAAGAPGTSTRPRPCRRASARRAARRGAGRAPAQPKRAAPSRRHADQVAARERAAASRGRARARCAPAARPGRARRRPRARPSRDSSANMPGHSPGARIHDGVGTSSAATRCVVRRFGAAYMHPACTTARLLGELLAASSLLDDVVADRRQPAVPAGAEPDPLDRRRAVAGDREHVLPASARA